MNEWTKKKSETKWGKQVRDELMRVVQKQSETNSNQKLGSKRIKETKTCVLPAGGEIGMTWKNVQIQSLKKIFYWGFWASRPDATLAFFYNKNES